MTRIPGIQKDQIVKDGRYILVMLFQLQRFLVQYIVFLLIAE